MGLHNIIKQVDDGLLPKKEGVVQKLEIKIIQYMARVRPINGEARN